METCFDQHKTHVNNLKVCVSISSNTLHAESGGCADKIWSPLWSRLILKWCEWLEDSYQGTCKTIVIEICVKRQAETSSVDDMKRGRTWNFVTRSVWNRIQKDTISNLHAETNLGWMDEHEMIWEKTTSVRIRRGINQAGCPVELDDESLDLNGRHQVKSSQVETQTKTAAAATEVVGVVVGARALALANIKDCCCGDHHRITVHAWVKWYERTTTTISIKHQVRFEGYPNWPIETWKQIGECFHQIDSLESTANYPGGREPW